VPRACSKGADMLLIEAKGSGIDVVLPIQFPTKFEFVVTPRRSELPSRIR
jgi:hypothetical protein